MGRRVSLSGGFKSKTYHIQSGDDDYLMNETRRKPTTGTRCPTLLISGTGSFIMSSRTDTAGHTKTFIYPVMDHGGGGG